MDRCVVQLKRRLQLLTDAGHMELDRCDTIIKQYKEMARAAHASDEFIKFEIGTSRLDTAMSVWQGRRWKTFGLLYRSCCCSCMARFL